MENISNEIKAKVFAQYLGQRIVIGIGGVKDDCFLHGIKSHTSVYTGINSVGVDSWYKLSSCKLILKPLSGISDEDAIEVAKMNIWFNRSDKYEVYQNWHGKKVVSSGAGIKYEKCVIEQEGLSSMAYQFLQFKGYDLPNWYLGGKTLHEAGLCIYEPMTQ